MIFFYKKKSLLSQKVHEKWEKKLSGKMKEKNLKYKLSFS